MVQTREKPRKKRAPPMHLAEVLTLSEAAAFLRIDKDEVVRLVGNQHLPGRLLGTEWRFLKSALEDWLRMPAKPGSKDAVLSAAGAWKDDPFVKEEVNEIYERRRRPVMEDGG